MGGWHGNSYWWVEVEGWHVTIDVWYIKVGGWHGDIVNVISLS